MAINVLAEDKIASDTPVRDVMSTYLVTIDVDFSVEEAAKILGEKGLRRILVIQER